MGVSTIEVQEVACDRCGVKELVKAVLVLKTKGWSCSFYGDPWKPQEAKRAYYCPKCTEFLKEYN